MPSFGATKRKDLIQYLRQLGFEGPYSGGKHQFMVKGAITLRIPNPHQGDISKDLLSRILRQAGIDKDDWEKL
ncbi:MAG: type II toxin-antitoxin system HicA family toxin [Acidobacteriota bacterium]